MPTWIVVVSAATYPLTTSRGPAFPIGVFTRSPGLAGLGESSITRFIIGCHNSRHPDLCPLFRRQSFPKKARRLRRGFVNVSRAFRFLFGLRRRSYPSLVSQGASLLGLTERRCSPWLPFRTWFLFAVNIEAKAPRPCEIGVGFLYSFIFTRPTTKSLRLRKHNSSKLRLDEPYIFPISSRIAHSLPLPVRCSASKLSPADARRMQVRW